MNLRRPRPFAIVTRLLLGLPVVAAANALAQPASLPAPTRPRIWITQADRAPILKKIQQQPWPRPAFDAMKARVTDAVAQPAQGPDTFLRDLALVPSATAPNAHPTLAHIGGNLASAAESGARGKLQRVFLTSIDCGALYFLIGDESYARCNADILDATVEAIVLMSPSESPDNGGWIYPDDHLYEAHALGAQVPLLYDFVATYLRGGATVHDLATKRQVPFDFSHAQQVFRTYARLAIEHGIINANWPVLEMPSLTHNVLALDDPAEHTRLLAYVTHEDTPYQDSLKKIVAEYAKPGAVWPESFQYSSGVSHLFTYLVALLRRQTPEMALPAGYQNIPLSLARLRDFRRPNGKNVRFGDSPRRSGDGYDSYEVAYALGVRAGDAARQSTFGALSNLGVDSGKYYRDIPHAHLSGANPYFGPLQLLWYAPTIVRKMSAPSPRTTDELGFAGAVLQRNLSPDGDPTHALAPLTKETPAPYDHTLTLTSVLVSRQTGEVGKRLFAVIYEPTAGSASDAIPAVTALTQNGEFAGFKVVRQTSSRVRTDYIIVLPTATSTFEDTTLGLSFTGRYADITLDDQDRCMALYVGEGTRLRFRAHDLPAATNSSAYAAFPVSVSR